MKKYRDIYCSFCGRPDSEAMMLVVGPNITCICEECVLQSLSIIVEKHPLSDYGDRAIGEVGAAKRASALLLAKETVSTVEEGK